MQGRVVICQNISAKISDQTKLRQRLLIKDYCGFFLLKNRFVFTKSLKEKKNFKSFGFYMV